MNEQVITLIQMGYDIHISSIKTITGLHHPQSLTHFQITLLKRIPGMRAKGGSCYANGKFPWEERKNPEAWEKVLNDLQAKVDKAAEIKSREVKL
jgi:hypothetical protein